MVWPWTSPSLQPRGGCPLEPLIHTFLFTSLLFAAYVKRTLSVWILHVGTKYISIINKGRDYVPRPHLLWSRVTPPHNSGFDSCTHLLLIVGDHATSTLLSRQAEFGYMPGCVHGCVISDMRVGAERPSLN